MLLPDALVKPTYMKQLHKSLRHMLTPERNIPSSKYAPQNMDSVRNKYISLTSVLTGNMCDQSNHGSEEKTKL
jgi:hypothetical protein